MVKSVRAIFWSFTQIRSVLSISGNAAPWKINNESIYGNRASILFYSTAANEDKNEGGVKNTVKISKAMKAYLQRAKEHDDFIKDQLHQYNVGKRHLANMMGEDPETFTQQDIDRSIEYLFPSGIFETKARPLMKPPDEIFPPRKAAEFDETGRPHHFLFYTAKANLYKVFYDSVEQMNSLNDFEDKMIRKQLKPDPTQAINTVGTIWLPKEELETKLVENLNERQYEDFIAVMERLLEHPYSYRAKDFIEKYRRPVAKESTAYAIQKPEYDADGRAFVTTKECKRKTAKADVTVKSPGTGLITINNKSIDYFTSLQDREQNAANITEPAYIEELKRKQSLRKQKGVKRANASENEAGPAGKGRKEVNKKSGNRKRKCSKV